MINVELFTRIDSDVNGNPRYYVPQYHFPDMSDKQRLALGLEKYRGKKYGSGFVAQTYSLEHTVRAINTALFGQVNFEVGDKARYKDEGVHGDVFTVLAVHGDTHVTLSLREYEDIEQDFQTNNDELIKIVSTQKQHE